MSEVPVLPVPVCGVAGETIVFETYYLGFFWHDIGEGTGSSQETGEKFN